MNLSRAIGMMLGILVSASLARAAEPILRPELGMHTGLIAHIDVDPQGRFAATASWDMTTRVWDLRTGQLNAVLRPSIQSDGVTLVGRQYAVAISPDGEIVVTGGQGGFLHVFQRAGARLLRELPTEGQDILALAWSPDGRYLAATTGAGSLTIYRTDDWRVLARDAGNRQESYGLDWNRDNRLVLASRDGTIRQMQVGATGLTSRIQTVVALGHGPKTVRFSPDGKRLAVAFFESTEVLLLEADSLATVGRADSSGTSAELSTVAFSDDGRFLYAGGRWLGSNGQNIRRWSDGGLGPYVDLPGSESTIADLQPTPGGGVMWASTLPGWGVLDRQGRTTHKSIPPIAQFWNQQQTLRISADGGRVEFGYEAGGGSPAVFDVALQTLTPGHGDPPLLSADVGDQLERNWRHTYWPRVDGVALAMELYEQATCIAFVPDDGRFVLGTEWNLRFFERGQRDPLWVTATTAHVEAVNLSADGRLVVAALSDGTIHWYRATDGRELLALLPHADRKRWVLWSPSSYFDASPGGEELVGLHVNRDGSQASDFFPVARLRAQFHRPDVISRILGLASEARAVAAANHDSGRSSPRSATQSLPPTVDIVSAERMSSGGVISVQLRIRLRTAPDAPVTALRVRVDGRAMELPQLSQLLLDASDEKVLKVRVAEDDREVALFAHNRYGWSEPARAATGASAGIADRAAVPAPRLPNKLYVLAVGISHYADPNLRLNYAAKDAADFVDVLKLQKGQLYKDVVVRLVTEEKASGTEIRKGLAWLRKEVTAQDVGMVFFSGHGDVDADGRYYYLPADVDANALLATALPAEDILSTLATLAGKAVFFVDSCHAGRLAEGSRRRTTGGELQLALADLASVENGVALYASSTGRQSSLENDLWRNGAFTKALVEGLSGRADRNARGWITHQALGLYLSDRVKELTEGQQHPVPRIEGVADFPIAAVR